MADEVLEEAVDRIQKCVKWSRGWSEANPDPVVADAVEDGLVTLGCLPKSRLQRMLSNEILEPQDLSESQMQYLGQQGLLDPEEVETVDDGDEEEGDEADDGDDGSVSLDDLDEDERERLVAEIREEIEEKIRSDDGGDEETGQEAETADDGDEEREEADGGGDSDDGALTASEAM